jgi:hypothetical protein
MIFLYLVKQGVSTTISYLLAKLKYAHKGEGRGARYWKKWLSPPYERKLGINAF